MQRPSTVLTLRPDEGSSPLVKVQIAVPEGPTAPRQLVVLKEYDTRNGREQLVRFNGPDGLVFKRKVHRPPPPPRNRPLPEPRAVKVTLVTAPSAQGVQLALAASAAMPAAEAAAAAAQPTQAATAAAHAQEQLPDVMASPGAVTSAGSEAAARQDAAGGGQDAIMAEAAPAAPAAQPETPAAAAAAPAQPAQQPHQPAAASKTAADKPMPQRAPARGAAVGTTAVVAAQADMMLPSTDMSHEEICAVLDQLPADASAAEWEVALAVLLARQEVAAELGDLQAPISAAPAPADAAAVESEAVPQAAEVAAAAAQKAAVAAALAAAAGDFVAAAADPFGFATPDASTQAALDAARRAPAAADGAGSADKPGFRGMSAAELAAARAAVQTRLDALIKEREEWDRLAARRAQLTPPRPGAVARAAADAGAGHAAPGGSAAAMDVTPDAACSAEGGQPPSSGEAALPAPIAAARGEAHAQLTLQVEGLCAMAEGVQALLVGAEATAAALQAGHDAAAFGGHAHIDSPAVLIRNALWPAPPPPTPAAERAARED